MHKKSLITTLTTLLGQGMINMEVAAIIEEFNAWKDSVAGRNGRCAIVDDWLKRRKLKRKAIANVIGVAPDTFEQLCYLDEPTKDYDEFAKLLRQ